MLAIKKPGDFVTDFVDFGLVASFDSKASVETSVTHAGLVLRQVHVATDRNVWVLSTQLQCRLPTSAF
jgi:hypothetical protein